MAVRDEMAAAICLPGFRINKAVSGDAILRINFSHPYSTTLSTWTLILSDGPNISSGKQVKPWVQVLNEPETFVQENKLSKYFLLSKSGFKLSVKTELARAMSLLRTASEMLYGCEGFLFLRALCLGVGKEK